MSARLHSEANPLLLFCHLSPVCSVDAAVAYKKDDSEEAIDAYQKLFAWKHDAATGTFLSQQTPVAVLTDALEECEDAWVPLFTVLQLEERVRCAVAQGAQHLETRSLPAHGQVAFLRAPHGELFGLWTPSKDQGPILRHEPVSLTWAELVSPDPQGSKALYEAVFGWTSERHEERPGFWYLTYSMGSRRSAGALAAVGALAGCAPHWAPYFVVSDLEATVAMLEALGGDVVCGPMHGRPGQWSLARTSGGTRLALLQR